MIFQLQAPLDALGRTTGQEYIDGTKATFTFDPAGEQITMQDVTGVTTNLWDNAGRRIGVVNGAGKALTYTLDPVGNRGGMVDSDAGLTTYAWDAQSVTVHSRQLFVFVEHLDVPSDNNPAERAVRPFVVKRKISGGTRSGRGSQTQGVLMSLFSTWQLRNQDALHACQHMLASGAARAPS